MLLKLKKFFYQPHHKSFDLQWCAACETGWWHKVCESTLLIYDLTRLTPQDGTHTQNCLGNQELGLNSPAT